MEKIRLIELINEGNSTYNISDILKTSQTNVRYWLKKYELKTTRLNNRNREGLLPLNGEDKICFRCKENKKINNFHKKIKSSGYHSYCKKCLNDLVVIRLQNIKIKSIEYKGGKCYRCGYNKYFGALEFHHRDNLKKDFSISSSCKNFENIKSELDKCDLVCANCHRELHFEIRNDK